MPGVIVDRIGVRHARDRGEAAGNRRRRAGRDRLLVLLARLAQMHVDVDQARAPRSSPDCTAMTLRAVGRQVLADPRDRGHPRSARRTRRRVLAPDRRRVRLFSSNVSSVAPRCLLAPASRYSTAIRTATPLATCSRITEYGPSATSESISTPRFIGPGCMMMTSGCARRSRCGRQPEQREVLARRRDEVAVHPLVLDPQHHDDVGARRPLRRSTSSRCTPKRVELRAGSASPARSPRPRAHACSAGARFDRSTRLCSRSPTIATLRPSSCSCARGS